MATCAAPIAIFVLMANRCAIPRDFVIFDSTELDFPGAFIVVVLISEVAIPTGKVRLLDVHFVKPCIRGITMA